MAVARVALVLLLVLPACAFGDIWNGCGGGRPEGVQRVDVVGVYGNPDSTLTLDQDGRFEAKGLRRKDHDGDRERVMSGTGTWRLNDRDGRTKRSEDYADIPLTFDDTGETWYRIDLTASLFGAADNQMGYHVTLYYLFGDTGHCEIVSLERRTPSHRRPSPPASPPVIPVLPPMPKPSASSAQASSTRSSRSSLHASSSPSGSRIARSGLSAPTAPGSWVTRTIAPG
jgi:hypothetical protein